MSMYYATLKMADAGMVWVTYTFLDPAALLRDERRALVVIWQRVY